MTDTQDTQSHRVIEKRRRDRINNSLADLGNLVAEDWSRQGYGRRVMKYTSQGRVKKSEIIEMAIQRIHQLQSELLGLSAYKFSLTLSIFISINVRPLPSAVISKFLLLGYIPLYTVVVFQHRHCVLFVLMDRHDMWSTLTKLDVCSSRVAS